MVDENENNLKSLTTSVLIYELRKKFGLSQEMLARKLSISTGSVRNFEKSRYMPNRDSIKAFVNFCQERGLDLTAENFMRK